MFTSHTIRWTREEFINTWRVAVDDARNVSLAKNWGGYEYDKKYYMNNRYEYELSDVTRQFFVLLNLISNSVMLGRVVPT